MANTPVNIAVLNNDTDCDGNIVPPTVNIGCPACYPPANGNITIDPLTGNITYTPNAGFMGQDTLVYEVCDSGIPVMCDTALVIITVGGQASCLRVKVFLQGPYSDTTQLMRDKLRTQGFIPLTEPYSASPYITGAAPFPVNGFVHYGGGGGETITDSASVFGVTGPNAIVDWVFIELRDKNNNKLVKYTRSALIQRDGDVVEVDGINPICFMGLDDNEYYIAVRHRNHLGVMTAQPKPMTAGGLIVDFTNGSEPEFNFGNSHPIAGPVFNYTGLSQKALSGGKRAMWFGNANVDRKVKYQAPYDDIFTILNNDVLYPTNIGYSYNFDSGYGYYAGDIDMSGKVKLQAPHDDSYLIFYQLMMYPLNSTFNYNFDVLYEQLPF
jgi:hypothetical protein